MIPSRGGNHRPSLKVISSPTSSSLRDDEEEEDHIPLNEIQNLLTRQQAKDHEDDLHHHRDGIRLKGKRWSFNRFARHLLGLTLLIVFSTVSFRLGVLNEKDRVERGSKDPSGSLSQSSASPPSEGQGSDMRRSLIQDLVSQTSYSDKDKSRSRIWSPIRLTECIENVTQPYYAPCQAEVVNQRFGGERVLYAEELIYPDFAIREPIYPKGDSGTSTRRRWKEIMSREGRGLARGVDGVDWWQYNGERGQNFLLANVSYQGPSFDSWSSEACMGNEAAIGYLKSHHDEQAFGPISEGGDPNILDLALLANSPDSWSFQHFLDRGTHEIAQGLPLALASRRSFEKWVDGANPTEPRLVIGKGANKEVNDLRRMMLGDKLDQATVHGDSNLRARWLVDPCRTPLIHPWLSLKALERIQVPTSKARPMSERKVVIYAGRGDGSATNGGRNVVNEEELVSAMEGLLERRGQGEKLVKFTKNMFANLTETMDYFASNVRAIVGPHGGALMNSRWVPPGSLLVEMMPTSFTSIAIYEEASVLGLHYASIIVEPTGKNDLTIDPNDVVGILEDHLGRQGEEPPVKHNYMWRSKELDVQGVDLQSWKESQAEGAIRGMRRVVKREGGGLSRGER